MSSIPYQRFEKACLRGRMSQVKDIWKEYHQPKEWIDSSTTVDGDWSETPLLGAIMNGNLPLVQWIIEQTTTNPASTLTPTKRKKPGSSHSSTSKMVNPKISSIWSSPLIQAIDANQEEIVEYLLQCGADLSQPDSFGRTPLSLAIVEGNEQLLNVLLRFGALEQQQQQQQQQRQQRQQQRTLGSTSGIQSLPPLHQAIWSQHYSILEILLSYYKTNNNNNDNNAKDNNNYYYKMILSQWDSVGITPLCLALSMMSNLLLRLESMYLLTHDMIIELKIALEQSLSIIELLLNKGADPNGTTQDGMTPLHFLCHCMRRVSISSSSLTSTLLSLSPSSFSSSSSTLSLPFTTNRKIIHLLIQHGANIEATYPKKGWTLVYHAVRVGNLPMVQTVLEISYQCQHQKHHDDDHHHHQKQQRKHQFQSRSISMECKSFGSDTAVKPMTTSGFNLHPGSDPNAYNTLSSSPSCRPTSTSLPSSPSSDLLYEACQEGYFDIVQLLVEQYGVDLQQQQQQKGEEEEEILDIFPDNTTGARATIAKLNVVMTPCAIAATNGYLDIVYYLIRHGALFG